MICLLQLREFCPLDRKNLLQGARTQDRAMATRHRTAGHAICHHYRLSDAQLKHPQPSAFATIVHANATGLSASSDVVTRVRYSDMSERRSSQLEMWDSIHIT